MRIHTLIHIQIIHIIRVHLSVRTPTKVYVLHINEYDTMCISTAFTGATDNAEGTCSSSMFV